MIDSTIGVSLIKEVHHNLLQKINFQDVKSNESVSDLFFTTQKHLASIIGYYNLLPAPELQQTLNALIDIDYLSSTSSEADITAQKQFRSFLRGMIQLNKQIQVVKTYKNKPLPEQLRKEIFENLSLLNNDFEMEAKQIVKGLAGESQSLVKELWKKAKLSNQKKIDAAIERLKLQLISQQSDFEIIKYAVDEIVSEVVRTGLNNDSQRKLILQKLDVACTVLEKNVNVDGEHIPEIKSHLLKLSSQREILENMSSLPTSLTDLKATDSDAIERQHKFFEASRRLIQANPNDSYILLRKIAKRAHNPFLQEVFKSTSQIDLGEAPIPASLLSEVASLHPVLQQIIFGDVMGDQINLTSCNPLLTAKVLERMKGEVKTVILPVTFFGTKKCEDLIQSGKGKVNLSQIVSLYIQPLEGENEPLEISGIQLRQMMALFPKLGNLRLPAVRLVDNIFSKDDVSPKTMWEYVNNLNQAFSDADERVKNACIRALAKGGKPEDRATLHLLLRHLLTSHLSSNRINALWDLNQSDSLQELSEQEDETGRHPFSEVFFSKGSQETSHLLLAMNRLDLLVVDSRFGGIDFSYNPLLSDSDLSKIHPEDRVRSLTLAYCDAVSDSGIKETLTRFKELQKLDLRGCAQITDLAFSNLPQNALDKMMVLDLRGTRVSQATILKLKAKYLQLTVFLDEKGTQMIQMELKRQTEGERVLFDRNKNPQRIHQDILAFVPEEYVKIIENLKSSLKTMFKPPSLSTKALDVFIKLVYTGSLRYMDQDVAVELMMFAKKSKYQDLYRLCELWLVRSTDINNAFERYEIAKQNQFSGLENYLRIFIDITCHPDSKFQPELNERQMKILQELLVREDPIKVPEFLDLKMNFSSYPLGLDITRTNPQLRLASNLKIEVKGKGTDEKYTIKGSLVALNAHTSFRQKLTEFKTSSKKKAFRVESSRPRAAKEIIESLMTEAPLNFKGRTIHQVLDLLKESDKMGVEYSVVDDEKLADWMKDIGSSLHFDDPAWLELLQWAKSRNNSQIGLRFLLLFRYVCYSDKQSLKPEYANNPFRLSCVRSIESSPEFQYFRDLIVQNKNSYRLNALLRFKDEPFIQTVFWKY